MNLKSKMYKTACVLGISLIFSLSVNGNFLEKLEKGRKALEDSLQNMDQPLGLGGDESPKGPRVSTRIEAEHPQNFVGKTLSGRFAEYMIFRESTIFTQIEVLYEGFAKKSNLKEAARSLNRIYNPQSYDDNAESTDLKDFYFSAQMISEDVDPRRTVTEVSNAVDARNLEVAGQNIRKLYAVPYDPSTLNVFWEAQKQTLPTPDAELVMDAVEMYLPAYDLLLSEMEQYLTLKRTSSGTSSYGGFRSKFTGIGSSSTQISDHGTVNGYFPCFFDTFPIVSVYGAKSIKEAISQLPAIQLETIVVIGDFFLEYPSFFLHGNAYQRENDMDTLADIVNNARVLLQQKRESEGGELNDETGGEFNENEINTNKGNSLSIEGLDL